jgi:lipopolysaccharide/colanic/teichoic acid biosynthesis glycosyltransferase
MTHSLADFAVRVESTGRRPAAAQRVWDLALVIVTAVAWVPLLGAALAAKWLIDGTPVMFHQVRVGRGGREFVLHKIRTTPPDFEARPDDWSDGNYPPRTRFGHLLQRFDLDELPQLWNVLRGKMSLAGPRPETPYHCARFARMLPNYNLRHTVLPGLTGHAQVHGFRGNTSIAGRLALDLDYVARQGFAIYAVTLARTLSVEFRKWFRR